MGGECSQASFGSGEKVSLNALMLKKLPDEFFSEKIRYLDLSQNAIEEFPNHLPKLLTANFSSNGIKILTPQMINALMSYSHLITLNLSANEIFELPLCINRIENLENLILGFNKLESVQITNPSLKRIDLSQNRMSELPHIPENITLFNFSYNILPILDINHQNIIELYLDLVSLERISDESSFPNLEILSLCKNRIQTLPDLSKISPKLRELNISSNFLENIPILPQSISIIDISDNKIENIDALCNLPRLSNVVANRNLIQNIPSLPQSISKLFVSNNRIVRINCGSLPNLEELNLNDNLLSELPDCDGTRVFDLFVSRNRIKEIHVSRLGRFIKRLDFTDNELQILPDELFNLNLLHFLNVSFNMISEVPMSISSSRLKTFIASFNPIMKWPDFPNTIETISLSHCRLTDIGNNASSLENLNNLDISGNLITSTPSLKSVYLNLSQNSITEFPEIGQKCKYIDISLNKLSIVPSMRLTALKSLDISYNSLFTVTNDFSAPNLMYLSINSNTELSMFPFQNVPQCDYVDISSTSIEYIGSFKGREILVSSPQQTSFSHPNIVSIYDWCSYSSILGKRESFEDVIIFEPNYCDSFSLFGVFDGHGGSKTATFVTNHIKRIFKGYKSISSETLKERLDRIGQTLQNRTFGDGTTMAMCVITKKVVHIAHLGDTRAIILDKDNQLIYSTIDHKPTLREEYERIRNEGGRVQGARVHSILAISRSYGDFLLPGVGSKCDIKSQRINSTMKWLIIACDGVFDVLSMKNICTIASFSSNAKCLASSIKNAAFSLMSNDNISVIAIDIDCFSNCFIHQDIIENE